MPRRALSLVAALLLQGATSEAAAQGAEPTFEAEFVFVEGICPSAAEVTRETLRLTPSAKHGAYAENVRVTLQDLGASYHLQIHAPDLKAERTYVDAGRDCSRRARFAAVLIVLTLMPPQVTDDPGGEVMETSPPPGEGKPPLPTVNPASLPAPVPTGNLKHNSSPMSEKQPRRSWVHLDLGAALRWAPPLLKCPELLQPGGTLILSVGPGSLHGFASAAVFPTVDFLLQGIAARVRQIPFAAGLGLKSGLGPFSLTGNVGLLAELTRVQGSGLVSSETHAALRWGARLGTMVSLERLRVSPAWGLSLDVYPSPGDLSVVPIGRLGSLPAVQLTTFLGGRIGF